MSTLMQTDLSAAQAAQLLEDMFVGQINANNVQTDSTQHQFSQSLNWTAPMSLPAQWAMAAVAIEAVCNRLIGAQLRGIELIAMAEQAAVAIPRDSANSSQSVRARCEALAEFFLTVPNIEQMVIYGAIDSHPLLAFGLPTSNQLQVQFSANQIEPLQAFKLLERIAACLERLQANPYQTATQMSQLTSDEKKLLLDLAESRVKIDTNHIKLVDLFDQQANAHAGRCAIIWQSESVSYVQLQEASLALAQRLTKAGVEPGDVVLVKLQRSPACYAALLALLRVGAIYLPIDKQWPAARIAVLQDTASARYLLSEVQGQSIGIDQISIEPLRTNSQSRVRQFQGRTDLAYVMFTSGSTGTPKGVLIPQRAIVRLTQKAQFMNLDASVRMLQAAPLGFDASTLEIWGPLLNGGCCVMHDEEIPTARGLKRTIQTQHVNTAWLTSALFNSVIDQGPEHLRGLQQLAIGGEALSVEHVKRALAALPDIRLINGYGPTECTTFSATYDITAARLDQRNSVPIGYALTNTVNRVLNNADELVPTGFVGQLYIGGDGLAEGYLGDPSLTAEKFISDPYGDVNARLYKTGDRVRLLANGALEFLGRRDGQVKLRGHRIELAEVEAAINQHTAAVNCCALIRQVNGEPQLVAYVVLPAPQFDIKQLREALHKVLPSTMIPSQWVRMDSLPVTTNGKVDRTSLPEPITVLSTRPEPVVADSKPASSTNQELLDQVAASFCHVLGIASVSPRDHFFELGGTSLGVTRAVAYLEKTLGIEVSVVSFFGNPTVQGVADSIALSATPQERVTHGFVNEPIAIIGMALKVPGADSLDQFWQNLVGGVDSITHFSPEQLDPSLEPALINDSDYVKARGVINRPGDFDAAFFGISPAEAALLDPQQRLFLELCWQCMEDAGCPPGSAAEVSSVGVFAGVYNASYYQHHVRAHAEKIAALGEFQVMLANEKDYVATRAAHKLNLTGPAVNVFSACSTSLVAIAQAVDSLRLGHCQAALAGAASITCPPNSGYLYQEGSMLSPDGKTRSFDSQAAGTVFSDGAAVVMLKRLRDAIAQGDPIHAVIRGVATNNDGAHKASFTAPSVDGQAAVIKQAHANAGVIASQISYVEAHGTATPLGDPIEVQALKRAFTSANNPTMTAPCLLGSVKSNIGHTVMAAGAVGLIKTVLSLKHEILPASIHCSTPSPRLGLADSTFKVVASNTPWPANSVTRLAGVSSFGVGGTNAHLVVQEAPPRSAQSHSSPASRHPVALSISARTQSSLNGNANALASFLKNNPSIDLHQVAATLERGRKPFALRRVVVGTDPQQLAQVLVKSDSLFASDGQVDNKPTSTTWLFPGQGSQYAGMGKALYEQIPEITQQMDICFAILLKRCQLDLKPIMFEANAQQLAQTQFTQPALFVLEYTLGQFWLSQGQEPDRLIGHSVGEFVAAALAQVMSLADALFLVAQRGALMQAQPPGAMLAVRLPLEQLTALLPANVELAASNGPLAQVVAGPQSAIDQFATVLSTQDITHKQLTTSHAFHSAMMLPASQAFTAVVANVSLSAPRRLIVSTVTGQTLTAAQAVDPHYWAQHLRLPVMFGKALQTAVDSDPRALLLEIGPNQHLSSLAKQTATPLRCISSLASEPATELTSLFLGIAKLWTVGLRQQASVNPAAYMGVARLSLPTYHFDRQTYWLDAKPVQTPMIATTSAANLPVEQSANLLAELEQLFESVSGTDLSGTDPNARFTELGLDSLTLTQAALQLKRKYAVKISFRDLMENYSSMQALASFLSANVAPTPTMAQPAPTSIIAPAAPTPIAPTLAVASATPMINSLEMGGQNTVTQLIANQLQLMQQQLALLGASPANSSAQPLIAVEAPVTAPSAVQAQLDAPIEANEETQQYDVKKAFGAIARIHTTRSNELTTKQKNRLEALVERYTARTQKSKQYTQQHRPHLADPRVVNGFRPVFKEMIYQIVIERSAGAHVWDLDGNRYVDALNGFGMSLFGWQPAFLADALKKQIDLGYEIGPQHPLAGIVAQQFCEMTGSDRAALCNTGSEAVMGAVRIARTVTGKHLIVSFTGSYHGIFDEVVVRAGKALKTIPAAPGIMSNAGENVLVLEYGTEESLRIIRERAEDIAAVLVEPVQSRRPDFQPIDFLKSLRKLTSEKEIVLVFDEIVTGFRCHPGGTQALFGIQADLATYGKVVGGGLSIGVVAGKREFMDALDGGAWYYGDDSIPTVGVTYFAGTFVRHPLALAAAHAVLNHLKKHGPSLQEALTAQTTDMVKALNRICQQRQAPIEIRSFSSVWRTVFLEEHPYQDLLFAMMRSRGIHILDNFPCFLTTAHSAEDISAIIEAFEDSLIELQEGGFIPGRPADIATTMDNNKPPVPGARLGRNQEGKIVWFIENPERTGKFIEYRSA
jgi:amino acid adenylation domain-containing protein